MTDNAPKETPFPVPSSHRQQIHKSTSPHEHTHTQRHAKYGNLHQELLLWYTQEKTSPETQSAFMKKTMRCTKLCWPCQVHTISSAKCNAWSDDSLEGYTRWLCKMVFKYITVIIKGVGECYHDHQKCNSTVPLARSQIPPLISRSPNQLRKGPKSKKTSKQNDVQNFQSPPLNQQGCWVN